MASPIGNLQLGYDGANVRALSVDASGVLQTATTVPTLDTTPAMLTAPGPGATINVANFGALTVQLVVAGINTNIVVRLEGSLDGTNWFNLEEGGGDQTITIDGTYAFKLGVHADKFIRLNFVSETGGTTAIIDYQVFAR